MKNVIKKEKIKKMSTKIVALLVIVVFFVVTILISVAYFESRSMLYNVVEDQCVDGSRLLELSIAGTDDLLEQDKTQILDNLKEATGYEFTIFNGDERVYTTVISNGERAVGTVLDPTIANIVLNEGEHYVGDAEIFGVKHRCSYLPYKNSNGEIIGILFAGVPVDTILPQLFSTAITNAIVAIVILLVSIVIANGFVKKVITNRLSKVVSAANSIAEGDFNFELIQTQNDEIGMLTNSFLKMQENLTQINEDMVDNFSRLSSGDWTIKMNKKQLYLGQWQELYLSIGKMIQSVYSALSQVADSSSQILAGSQQVSQGAQALASSAMEQSDGIEKLSNKLSDISANVSLNFSNADKANNLAVSSGEVTQVTMGEMLEMKAAMDDIYNTFESISSIIKVIDEIAFQTNILALNAAVEAARAGSAGSGFAVVADEVRNLAQRSADAAQDTNQLISKSVETVNSGVQIMGRTNLSFEDLASKVNEMVVIIDEISVACKEQAESLRQTTNDIEQISAVVHLNSATSEESAAASEELSGQAGILSSMMEEFKF